MQQLEWCYPPAGGLCLPASNTFAWLMALSWLQSTFLGEGGQSWRREYHQVLKGGDAQYWYKYSTPLDLAQLMFLNFNCLLEVGSNK